MKIADNISWKVLQDKVVAVDTKTGIYYTMNAVASEIWQAIAAESDVDAIASSLAASYPDVDAADLKSDLDEQLEYWKAEHLIV